MKTCRSRDTRTDKDTEYWTNTSPWLSLLLPPDQLFTWRPLRLVGWSLDRSNVLTVLTSATSPDQTLASRFVPRLDHRRPPPPPASFRATRWGWILGENCSNNFWKYQEKSFTLFTHFLFETDRHCNNAYVWAGGRYADYCKQFRLDYLNLSLLLYSSLAAACNTGFLLADMPHWVCDSQ